jgi:hypothetical protein
VSSGVAAYPSGFSGMPISIRKFVPGFVVTPGLSRNIAMFQNPLPFVPDDPVVSGQTGFGARLTVLLQPKCQAC